MKKKHRVPKTERSAFEDAKAALERAGEDPSETPKPSAPETVSDTEAPATENLSDTKTFPPIAAAPTPEIVDSAEPSGEPDAAPVSEASESDAEISGEPDAVPAPEIADSAEASGEPDAAPAPEIADADSVPAFAAVESPETSENAPILETAPLETNENIPETPVPIPGTVFSVSATKSDGNPQNAAPSDAHAQAFDADKNAEPSEYGAAYAESVWEFMEDAGPEITETEKHTMEIKEITLNARRNESADAPEEPEAVKEPKERVPKPRFQAFDRIKDAILARADAPESDDGNPPSASARDAALRKRVMRIEDDETRNYLLDRVLPQITWYGKKSARYQTMYYRLMAATILLGALIPVFSVGGSYAAVKVILALLGASVTAINAYIALHNYHNLSITYRMTREDLTHTLYCYFNRAGVFSQKQMSDKDLDVLLVDVCEDTFSKENGGWTTIVQKM